MFLIKFIIILLFKFPFVFTIVDIQIPRAKLTDEPTSLISLKTDLGTVIGYNKEVLNKTINVFNNLPYAEPPIGKLRFRKTRLITKLPVDPYSSLDFKPHCAQKYEGKFNRNDTFSEDCLFMSIYTPNLESKINHGRCDVKYPVMIYVYGTSNSIYLMAPYLDQENRTHLSHPGDLFATHNTVFVTFNYRFDLFATLYLQGELSANLAMFDQNLAIQFVKKHIKDYCGDNEKITLFGNSFGSLATGMHLISRYSKDLIQNAIMQSGSGLFHNAFGITRNEISINSLLAINELGCLNLENSKITDHIGQLTKDVRTKFFDFYEEKEHLKEKVFFDNLRKNWYVFQAGLKFANDYLNKDDYIDAGVLEMVRFLSGNAVDLDCLEKLTTEQIMNIDRAYTENIWLVYYDFDFIDTEAYLDYKLFNRLNLNPKLNLLIGGLEQEKCESLIKFKNKYPTDQFNAPVITKEDTKEIIKNISILKTDKEGFATGMADYYTNETKWRLSEGYAESALNLLSDQVFNCPIHFYNSFAALTANSVSSYHITQKATKHHMSAVQRYDLNDYYWLGPCHADELIYMFGLPLIIPNHFTDLDREFSLKLVHLWTSFARDGKMPNQQPSNREWPSTNKQHPKPRYVEINTKFTREREFELEKRCEEFWRPLLSLYKR